VGVRRQFDDDHAGGDERATSIVRMNGFPNSRRARAVVPTSAAVGVDVVPPGTAPVAATNRTTCVLRPHSTSAALILNPSFEGPTIPVDHGPAGIAHRRRATLGGDERMLHCCLPRPRPLLGQPGRTCPPSFISHVRGIGALSRA
jgi:hypothetical protein